MFNVECYMQAVDKVRQRRSRGAQRLNVLQRVRFASSLAAALLDGLSEQPATASERVREYSGLAFLSCSSSLSTPCTLCEAIIQHSSFRERHPNTLIFHGATSQHHSCSLLLKPLIRCCDEPSASGLTLRIGNEPS